MKTVLALFLVAIVAACTQATPETLLSPAPLGSAKVDGDYANINVLPQGRTAQMTPTERDIAKADLQQEASRGTALRDAAAADGAARDDAAELRRKALAERERRIQQIETTNRL